MMTAPGLLRAQHVFEDQTMRLKGRISGRKAPGGGLP